MRRISPTNLASSRWRSDPPPWPPRRSRRLLTPRPLGRRPLPGTLPPSGHRHSGSASRRRLFLTQKATVRFSRSRSIRSRVVWRSSSPSRARSSLESPSCSPRSMRSWRTQLPKGGVVDTKLAGDHGDRPATGTDQPHRVTFELRGALASGPWLLVGHADTLCSSEVSGQRGEVQIALVEQQLCWFSGLLGPVPRGRMAGLEHIRVTAV